MNHRSSNSSIDWLELDRLVDGRLDGDEYRELLCQIDADPDGWRHCALAFLEHQALSRELSAFANDPDCEMLPCMGSIVQEEQAGTAKESAIAVGRKSDSSSASAMIGWFSMALCIVCGLAIGITLQSDFRDRLEVPPMQHVTKPFANQVPADEILKDTTGDAQVSTERENVAPVSGKKDQCTKNRCQKRFSLHRSSQQAVQREYNGMR